MAQALLPFSITKVEELRKLLAYIDTKDWLHYYTADEVATALAAYQQGASLRAIERTYGISSRSLRGHAKRCGVILRPRIEAIHPAQSRKLGVR